ncbi:hypothetical protein CIC07_24345 [Paenibacillus sp. RUD330]|nr:hypothetical protein CIC07_24345 [Paenibacillus sp. RUD330]
MKIENPVQAKSREALRSWLQEFGAAEKSIQSHKNQPELFKSRLDKFMTCTRQNKMYGQWHDQGRFRVDGAAPE